jgi:hypothetical protein
MMSSELYRDGLIKWRWLLWVMMSGSVLVDPLKLKNITCLFLIMFKWNLSSLGFGRANAL